MQKLFVSLFFSLAFLGQVFAQVNGVITPIREVSELADQNPVTEEVVRPSNVRVMIADYELIRQDFPQVANLSNPQIDQWLIEQVGYISRPQAAQAVVNSSIELSGQTRQALRPYRYGRALVYPVEGGGMIDVKGVGSLSPAQTHHGNGLATLGECLREFLYENSVREVLEQENVPSRTVGSYAVFSAGFDVIHEDGSRSPAGFYLRQAHTRFGDEQLREIGRGRVIEALEMRGIEVGGNLQGTREGAIVDFGHFLTTPTREQTVYDQVVGGRPYPRLPADLWSYAGVADSKMDRPFIWSHEVAARFARGEASRGDVWNYYRSMLDPVCELEYGDFSEEVMSRYIALLDDPSNSTGDRLRVIHLLTQSEDSIEKYKQVLIRMLLNHSDNAVRKSLVGLLSSSLGDPEIKRAVLHALVNDSSWEVRSASARSLASSIDDPDIKRAVLNALVNDSNYWARETIALSLASHIDDPEIKRALLHTLANDSSWQVRSDSALSLASSIDDPDIKRAVLNALVNDSAHWVRDAIARSFANHIDDPEIKRALLHTLVNDSSEWVRVTSARSLANHIDDPEIKRALLNALVLDPVKPVRFDILEILSSNGDDLIISSLVDSPNTLPDEITLNQRRFVLSAYADVDNVQAVPGVYQRLIVSSLEVDETRDLARSILLKGDMSIFNDEQAIASFRSWLQSNTDTELASILDRPALISRPTPGSAACDPRNLTNILRGIRDGTRFMQQ